MGSSIIHRRNKDCRHFWNHTKFIVRVYKKTAEKRRKKKKKEEKRRKKLKKPSKFFFFDVAPPTADRFIAFNVLIADATVVKGFIG